MSQFDSSVPLSLQVSGITKNKMYSHAKSAGKYSISMYLSWNQNRLFHAMFPEEMQTMYKIRK